MKMFENVDGLFSAYFLLNKKPKNVSKFLVISSCRSIKILAQKIQKKVLQSPISIPGLCGHRRAWRPLRKSAAGDCVYIFVL